MKRLTICFIGILTLLAFSPAAVMRQNLFQPRSVQSFQTQALQIAEGDPMPVPPLRVQG